MAFLPSQLGLSTALFPAPSLFRPASAGPLQPTNPLGQVTITGISGNTLGAAYNVDLLETGLRAINSQSRTAGRLSAAAGNNTTGLTSLDIPDTNRSLSGRANDAAGIDPFIDTTSDQFRSLDSDPDRQTAFTIFQALTRLQVIAEFAGQESTTDATRARLNQRFEEGLNEVRSFLNSADTNLLTFFTGSRESDAEATARIDEAPRDLSGAFQFDTRDQAIAGLTGTEQFSLSIAKPTGTPDVINIDLSGVTGTLSLDNIVSYINSQIEDTVLLDGGGVPVLDADNNPIPANSTRLKVNQDTGGTGKFGITIDATITETVTLSATSAAPSLFVASTLEQTTTDGADRVAVIEFEQLSGTIVRDDAFQFAGTDISGTEFTQLVDEANVDQNTDLDANIVSLRDQFRADALADIESNTTTTSSDTLESADGTVPITDIISDQRVQATTSAQNIASDSEGNLFVVGSSAGSFGEQINAAETSDVYLTKFDRTGSVIYSRLLGSSDSATGFAVTVDSADNVIIAGETNNALVATDQLDGTDAFVAKFNNAGDELFRYQLDTVGNTRALALTTDASNTIIVGGSSTSGITGAGSFSGVSDNFVITLDGSTGAQTGQAIFGTAGADSVQAIAIASDGNILVATEEQGAAVVRKLDATNLSTEVSSISLGSLGSGGSVSGIAVDGTTIVVTGATTLGAPNLSGATTNGIASGALDGFAVGMSDGGASLTATFSTVIGTSGTDTIEDVAINGTDVYVTGTTNNSFAGETSVGASDGYVARLDATTGALEDLNQFGTSFTRTDVAGATFSTQGDSVLDILGLPSGTINRSQAETLVTQTSARVGDFFYIEIEGKRTKIEITRDSDDYGDLARQINIAGLSSRSSVGQPVEARIRRTTEGDVLDINTVEGGPAITLIPGDADKDLLNRIGLPAGTLLPQDQFFNTDATVLGGTFSLDLDVEYTLLSQESALFSFGALSDAVGVVQRAFRSLTPNPLADLLDRPQASGTASQATLNRIANLTSGFQRLAASGLASNGLNLLT